MSDYNYFTVDFYENVWVITWSQTAASPALATSRLEVELRAFVSTAKPRCVVVDFARLTLCPSSLIAGLIGLNKLLSERGCRLQLCGMGPLIWEQFDRLKLNHVFAIHDSLADALTACETDMNEGGQHASAKTPG